ncbi:MAG TPA: glycosyltransferase [Gammaproteobacteria bacterium]|nr:glycosyltransferase [Gammaproteobacteria bacterium]
MVKLSVIIACFNEEATLADLLESLASQEWSKPWEIVFVDNRSTDNSLAIAKEYRKRLPNLKIVDASGKQGKPFALNKGITVSEGALIAFLDADDLVAPGWLPVVGKALEEHELIATRTDVETLNDENNRRYRGNVQAEGVLQIHYPPYLPHASGGTIGITRALNDKIGGFDESLRCLEDTDYLWKAQLAGATLHYVPEAVVQVRFRDDLRGIYRQRRAYAEYNVFLSRRYRSYGDPMPHPWHSYFNGWKRLLLSLKKLRRAPSRADWVGKLGWMVGRTRGIVKYRVPPV